MNDDTEQVSAEKRLNGANETCFPGKMAEGAAGASSIDNGLAKEGGATRAVTDGNGAIGGGGRRGKRRRVSNPRNRSSIESVQGDGNEPKVAKEDGPLNGQPRPQSAPAQDRRKKKPRRQKRRKWKPYYKLSTDERRELEEREAKRAERTRAQM